MKTADILTGPLFSLIGRNFVYNRFYTIVNICGLGFGLCCAIFILLFIRDELTYDMHHLRHERIYRLESDFTLNGKSRQAALTSYLFGPVFKDMFPEVESFVRFRAVDPVSVRAGNKDFHEKGLFFADSTVFDIFTHRFIYGQAAGALNMPNTIVLTRHMAERYFGPADPCGRYVLFGNGSRCMVTAVIEDVPGNSHLHFDGLVSMGTHAGLIGQEMFNALETRHAWAFRLYTYILLEENATIEAIHRKFPDFYMQHMEAVSEIFDGSYRLLSSPLTSIHLNSGLEWDLPAGDRHTVYLFAMIGIFILLIASVNYMNLATARSAGKAREVGIRKLCGAGKANLIALFISESVIMTMIALALALTMADLMMPWFNEISGKNLILLTGFGDPLLWILLLISLLLGILSGSYPAFYLAAFKPSKVLYNKIFLSRKHGWPRRLLIIFQFAISLSLVISTIVVFKQLQHLKTKDLGFNKENLIVISSTDSTLQTAYPALRAELMKISGVKNVASAMFLTGIESNMDIMKVEDGSQRPQELIGLNFISHNFVGLMEMALVAGRDFSRKHPSDQERHVLVNEAAVRKLGWTGNPIGKELSPSDNAGEPFKVIGILQDFHYKPLHHEIGPMVYFLRKEGQPNIFIRLSDEGHAVSIKKIAKTWKRILPSIPFTYAYLEQELESVYAGEQKLLRLMGMFALFSIFIALLGLFSLSSYLTEQNTRVIGIKRVFGASPFSIVAQLSGQYLLLILIACAIAIPVCWYLMDLWLNNFAYRSHMAASWFLLSTLFLLLMAESTVIIQSLYAANRNPADTLRYE